MNRDRAREILQTAYDTTTCGPWSDQLDKVMTREERAEICAVWDTMPGYTCFVDALYRIAREGGPSHGPGCWTIRTDRRFGRGPKPPELDERDKALLVRKTTELDAIPGPRVGDYIVFADGVARRISHIWDWNVPEEVSIQTSTDGSFYLGSGYMSFSGSLYSGVPGTSLTLTSERRKGSAWFFHHDHAQANNGVYVDVDCRVYTSTERAPS